MLLILGSSLDEHPRLLVERWDQIGLDAVLVTPADLSQVGWRLRRGVSADTAGVVGGRSFGQDEIELVVIALPWVGVYDLPHVVDVDREYVAQEMTSFLLAWLQDLDCPILDRPSPLSLAGCGRSALEWSGVADSVRVDADSEWTGDTVTVTVIGGRAAGDHPDALAESAEAVALAAGRSLVTLRFAACGRPVLVDAVVRPEVGCEGAADLLLDLVAQS